MCIDCGCTSPSTEKHTHEHKHEHKKIDIGTSVLDANNRYAQENRKFFKDKGVFVLNIISSPGSGKTTLLEAMAKHFKEKLGVIVGDIKTTRDADRINAAGSFAYQIETGGACHLDAHSISHCVDKFDFSKVRLLIIENVGNLVCPAAFDLGEDLKVGLLSTPEGDDKVLKYPEVFSRISTLLISKIDLLPFLNFNADRAVAECESLNKDVKSFRVSVTKGEGLDEFFNYITKELQ